MVTRPRPGEYLVEHQRPYGTVVARYFHASPNQALLSYRKCLRQQGSAVFIILNGKEVLPAELQEKCK